ncbi:MAG TPA: hypothetical protein PK916_09805 [Bacteroidota bacterium]|nr:hypothetical protein [Bacteroidota bacterium]
MNLDLQRIFTAKQERRQALAKLPIEEKVRILVKLQTVAAPLLRARGKAVYIWKLDDTPEDAE